MLTVKTKLISILLAAVLLAGLSVPAMAADSFGSESAVETFVDDSAATPLETTWIDGLTYAPIKSFGVIMGAQSVRCDQSAVTVEYNGSVIVFKGNSRIVKADDYRYFIADGPITMSSNSLMAPVEVLCRVFDARMVSGEDGDMFLATGAGVGDDLTEDDVELLAHMVQAEAGNQCMDGKIGVVNVVLNRIWSSEFPRRIDEIIYDRTNGIQFDTAYNGSLYNSPSTDCYRAVYSALEGVNTVGPSLFFTATLDCWASRNRPLYTVIQDHYFYV